MPPLVVSDTSPLRALVFLGRMDILESMFEQIYVPPAVVTECRSGRSPFLFDVSSYEFVEVIAPSNSERVAELKLRLDAGEAEAIAVAEELGIRSLLIDEHRGRMEVEHLGLHAIGTVGLLINAKQNNLVTAVRPLLSRLREELNFYLSEQFIEQALKAIGEA
ncbi:DUF3368 domain-containing protein [Planctellipticum variicoloris]|uniref:DUF3368 domain-containing protein n=1 Tax=Planctellipticum variicoloris TaxID=3064265 RepID=UPI003013AAE3|nr:DUF3368 domain-containing protein [Planctomycetaceae bacterium SH412]